MNELLLTSLIKWPRGFITGTDLKDIISASTNARKAIIKRAVQEGYLERIKRDFYLIKKISREPRVNAFEIAQHIHGPSYISFESALSIHGWIPEAVHVICSATVVRSKEFSTDVATFSYEKIPIKSFSLGVNYVVDGNSCYLLASPWKAIADLIYTRKKSWPCVNGLMSDLRIEADEILSSNLNMLHLLMLKYSHLATRDILKGINNSLNTIKESFHGNGYHSR